jgi:perosamine synthetase
MQLPNERRETTMIQVLKPSITEAEVEAVSEVLRSGWIGLGPKTAEFEKRFAAYVGAEYAVGLNSATAALDLSLKLLGINHGHEVIVPSMTFVSTAHVVAYNLATPVFADCDPDTLGISIEDVARRITARTRAIIPVHYGGRPVDMDALKEVVKGTDIKIVEDAAHATGASYKGKKVGTLADMACFSFHAVKNLAMGDGGAITLSDNTMMERAKRLRWLGIDKGTWDRTSLDRSYWWEYKVDEVGLKCHMNDIAAAMGIVQLSRLDEMNARRRAICSRYLEAFADVPEIELPPVDDQKFQSAWHIFCIKCDRRDDLSVFLRENEINTGVHYKPIHQYSCYGNKPSLPVSEALQHRILSLPMYADLTNEEVDKVIACVRKFYGR